MVPDPVAPIPEIGTKHMGMLGPTFREEPGWDWCVSSSLDPSTTKSTLFSTQFCPLPCIPSSLGVCVCLGIKNGTGCLLCGDHVCSLALRECVNEGGKMGENQVQQWNVGMGKGEMGGPAPWWEFVEQWKYNERPIAFALGSSKSLDR